MLSVLRKIRRSLFLPGKFRTYLAYAAGEIVLIVLGILIALQINVWRENRKLEAQRADLIESLTSDFQATIEKAETVIEDGQANLEEHLKFLKVVGGDITDLSVAEIKAIEYTGSIEFQPILGTLQTALSTGSIGLIDDTGITQLFVDFQDLHSTNQGLDRIHQQEVYSGTGFQRKLVEIVGDTSVIRDSGYYPKKFELSDEDYMEAITRKDFYTSTNAGYSIKWAQLRRVTRMKEKAEEIIEALNEL